MKLKLFTTEREATLEETRRFWNEGVGVEAQDWRLELSKNGQEIAVWHVNAETGEEEVVEYFQTPIGEAIDEYGLVDVDGDGDLDLMFGNWRGHAVAFSQEYQIGRLQKFQKMEGEAFEKHRKLAEASLKAMRLETAAVEEPQKKWTLSEVLTILRKPFGLEIREECVNNPKKNSELSSQAFAAIHQAVQVTCHSKEKADLKICYELCKTWLFKKDIDSEIQEQGVYYGTAIESLRDFGEEVLERPEIQTILKRELLSENFIAYALRALAPVLNRPIQFKIEDPEMEKRIRSIQNSWDAKKIIFGGRLKILPEDIDWLLLNIARDNVNGLMDLLAQNPELPSVVQSLMEIAKESSHPRSFEALTALQKIGERSKEQNLLVKDFFVQQVSRPIESNEDWSSVNAVLGFEDFKLDLPKDQSFFDVLIALYRGTIPYLANPAKAENWTIIQTSILNFLARHPSEFWVEIFSEALVDTLNDNDKATLIFSCLVKSDIDFKKHRKWYQRIVQKTLEETSDVNISAREDFFRKFPVTEDPETKRIIEEKLHKEDDIHVLLAALRIVEASPIEGWGDLKNLIVGLQNSFDRILSFWFDHLDLTPRLLVTLLSILEKLPSPIPKSFQGRLKTILDRMLSSFPRSYWVDDDASRLILKSIVRLNIPNKQELQILVEKRLQNAPSNIDKELVSLLDPSMLQRLKERLFAVLRSGRISDEWDGYYRSLVVLLNLTPSEETELLDYYKKHPERTEIFPLFIKPHWDGEFLKLAYEMMCRLPEEYEMGPISEELSEHFGLTLDRSTCKGTRQPEVWAKVFEEIFLNDVIANGVKQSK